MSSNLVNIKSFDYNNEIQTETKKDIEIQYSIFIDTVVYPLNSSGTIDVSFNRKIFIESIFIRELIVKISQQNEDFFNETRFLVLRFKDFSSINNNFVYNTSYINPDTDIILNKTLFDSQYLTFESKYVFNLYNQTRSFSSLKVQILNDKNEEFNPALDLGTFIDLKINASNAVN